MTYALQAAMILIALDIELPVDLVAELIEQGYDPSHLEDTASAWCYEEALMLEEMAEELLDTDLYELSIAFNTRSIELCD